MACWTLPLTARCGWAAYELLGVFPERRAAPVPTKQERRRTPRCAMYLRHWRTPGVAPTPWPGWRHPVPALALICASSSYFTRARGYGLRTCLCIPLQGAQFVDTGAQLIIAV